MKMSKTRYYYLESTNGLPCPMVSVQQLANLNWGTFVTANLIPVTLGNIIGGSLMVGLLYWLALNKLAKKKS